MGYQYHDMMLGRLLELAGDDTTVILMSDHGFHPDHLRTQVIPSEPAGPAIEHRDYGIFLAKGPGIKKDEVVHGAGLMDVTPTILKMYLCQRCGELEAGQPNPSDMSQWLCQYAQAFCTGVHLSVVTVPSVWLTNHV